MSVKDDTVRERISGAFDRLIMIGRKAIEDAGYNGRDFELHFPRNDEFQGFRASALSLVKRSFGESSDHYKELMRLADEDKVGQATYRLVNWVGVVESAKRDFDDGLIMDLRSLIAADLLGDLIEQATELLRCGYYVPAASLAGAVLEDALRELCQKEQIPVPDKTSINVLNTLLYKKEIYSNFVQKNITAWADIRNNADHGRIDEFKKSDVKDMIKWILRFCDEFLI